MSAELPVTIVASTGRRVSDGLPSFETAGDFHRWLFAHGYRYVAGSSGLYTRAPLTAAVPITAGEEQESAHAQG